MSHSPFAPRDGVFLPEDVNVLRSAYHLALADDDCTKQSDDAETLGRLIIRLYRMGLVQPDKLASAASFMFSSRLFQSPLY
jgi:hypothetical protein